MNDMYREEDYRDNYRDNYRDDYRDGYRENNRDYRDYRNYRDYREDYRRGVDRKNYRNYRDKENYYAMLEEAVGTGMELARMYEDMAEMASNSKDKSSLMKIAEREKEHYRAVKEMLDHTM